MTKDEAWSVIVAASKADSGCSHCIIQVLEELAVRLPEVDWEAAVPEDAEEQMSRGYDQEEIRGWIKEAREAASYTGP